MELGIIIFPGCGCVSRHYIVLPADFRSPHQRSSLFFPPPPPSPKPPSRHSSLTSNPVHHLGSLIPLLSHPTIEPFAIHLSPLGTIPSCPCQRVRKGIAREHAPAGKSSFKVSRCATQKYQPVPPLHITRSDPNQSPRDTGVLAYSPPKEHCRRAKLPTPVFNIVSDRRGTVRFLFLSAPGAFFLVSCFLPSRGLQTGIARADGICSWSVAPRITGLLLDPSRGPFFGTHLFPFPSWAIVSGLVQKVDLRERKEQRRGVKTESSTPTFKSQSLKAG